MAAVYTLSIVFGRLYCGMHGFLDVIVGITLGAILAVVEWVFCDRIDAYVYGESFTPILVIMFTILVLVRIHPEPADACPCFDDGVAFAAVIGGIELGCWRFSKSKWSTDVPVVGTIPFSYHELGFVKTVLRFLIGKLHHPSPELGI